MMIDEKIIISGSVLEYFRYSRQVEVTEEKKRVLTGSSAISLRRLISANAGQWYNRERMEFYMPIFITLTFSDNVSDLTFAHKEFMRFIKRFNYEVFGSKYAVLAYVAVPEFQQRGAVHYHVVMFNVPFIHEIYDVMADLWGHGYVLIKTVREVSGVGFYMAKYLSKSKFDERFVKRKKYFGSRNLMLPFVCYDFKYIIDFMEAVDLDSRVYSTQFENQYTGMTTYQIFDLSESPLRVFFTDKFAGQVDEDIVVSEVGLRVQEPLFQAVGLKEKPP